MADLPTVSREECRPPVGDLADGGRAEEGGGGAEEGGGGAEEGGGGGPTSQRWLPTWRIASPRKSLPLLA